LGRKNKAYVFGKCLAVNREVQPISKSTPTPNVTGADILSAPCQQLARKKLVEFRHTASGPHFRAT
jgi:hypothetical protein